MPCNVKSERNTSLVVGGCEFVGGENDYLCDKLKAVITPCRFSANFQAV